jgi:hypothetical protein
MKTEEQIPVPEPARGHDVFVSYSRADRERVVELTQALAERGKRAWVDLENIPPSAEWMAEIRSAIESADGYLVAVSPDAARSKVCLEELEHARSSGKRIVPVLVRPTDPDSVPQALAALNWIDATDGALETAADRIVQALDTDLDHVKAHTRLLVRASEWEGRDHPGSLLLRGEDLKQAEALLVSAQGKEPATTPVQARYVQASRQGTSRRQRIVVVAVAVALALSLVLTAVALVQRGEAVDAQARAEEQTRAANSRALAAQALVHIDQQLDLAILLSLEAYRTAPTPEALDVLHIAAQRSLMIEQTLPGSDAGAVVFTQEAGKEAVAYSPDGELIASGDTDGNVILWAAETGDAVGEPITADVGAVQAITFDPVDGTLLVGGDGGSVSRWDPSTGVEVAPRLELADPVTSLAFSPDARRIAVGTDPGDVSLFDAEDGSVVAGPEGFGRQESDFNSVSGLAFSPDGTGMAIGSESGELVLVDPETLQMTDGSTRTRGSCGLRSSAQTDARSPRGS